MSKMDDGTRKHLRAWVERYAPVPIELWDETEEKMISVWESEAYYQNTTWTRVFEQVESGFSANMG